MDIFIIFYGQALNLENALVKKLKFLLPSTYPRPEGRGITADLQAPFGRRPQKHFVALRAIAP